MYLKFLRNISVGLLFSVAPITFSAADTLTDALISAYQTSPTLQANYASLRSVDERVAQARVGKRPQVSANASANSATNTKQSGVVNTMSANVQASLNLYDGGNTKAAIESARATVAASRENLVQTEQTVLLNAATAYFDVRRNLKNVELASNNIKVLKKAVDAANVRFEVGEITRTDVSQAKARLALAYSQMANAEGALAIANETYVQAVGRRPNNLQAPPRAPALPKSMAAAQSIAIKMNPTMRATRFVERSAKYDYERSRTNFRPRVDISGQAGPTYDQNGNTDSSAQAAITGSVPIYNGGQLSSLKRQARAVLDQRRAEIQVTGLNVKQAVAAAWSNLETARALIKSNKRQVQASKTAYDSVVQEALLGSRTTIDALNAEQELLNAHTNLVSSKRDASVAVYNLLASMGLMTVKHLGLGIKTYDVNQNYRKVQHAPYSSKQGNILDKIKNRWE